MPIAIDLQWRSENAYRRDTDFIVGNVGLPISYKAFRGCPMEGAKMLNYDDLAASMRRQSMMACSVLTQHRRIEMKLIHKAGLVAAASFTIMVAGCKPNATTTANDSSQNSAQSAPQRAANDIKNDVAQAGAVVADSAITAKVKAAIVADPVLSALDIKVETSNGVVTLSGTIDSQQKLQQVTQLAQAVDGVKAVNNQMGIKSTS